jgi:carbon monoxide dehydrogenase subunit G
MQRGGPAISWKRSASDWGYEAVAVIETEQSISINSGIDNVWEYVKDIRNWANLMPGAQTCTMINPEDSCWTLKVGAGGLVRTVTVLVHVEKWDAPTHVKFSYKLEGDPVVGAGFYNASPTSAHDTEIKLRIRVEGSGPMSRLWEAMSTPLLPQLVRSFAGRLKVEIEKAPVMTPIAGHGRGTLGKRLLTRWRTLIGSNHIGKELQ